MKKILHTTLRYAPSIGGVEDYVRQLLRHIQGDYAFKVLATDLHNHSTGERLDLQTTDRYIDNIEVQRAKVWPWKLKSYYLSSQYMAGLATEQTDLFHGHGFMYPSADATAFIAASRKKPFVLNPYLADDGQPSVWGQAYRKLMSPLFARAEALVVLTPYEEELLRRWGLKKLPCVVEVPPGVNLSEYDDITYNAFEKKGIRASNILLCVSRLDVKKGIDILLAALPQIFKNAPDTRLVIVGPDFGAQSLLQEQAKRLNVGERVHFLGAASRQDLCSFYCHATVVVFPSRFEAFGMVAAEAMAARTPVVAQRVAALPYVVRDGETGFLFGKEDEVDLADKVLQLLEDEKLRQQMGAAGRKRVEACYTWEKSAAVLKKIYKDVLDVGENSEG